MVCCAVKHIFLLLMSLGCGVNFGDSSSSFQSTMEIIGNNLQPDPLADEGLQQIVKENNAEMFQRRMMENNADILRRDPIADNLRRGVDAGKSLGQSPIAEHLRRSKTSFADDLMRRRMKNLIQGVDDKQRSRISSQDEMKLRRMKNMKRNLKEHKLKHPDHNHQNLFRFDRETDDIFEPQHRENLKQRARKNNKPIKKPAKSRRIMVQTNNNSFRPGISPYRFNRRLHKTNTNNIRKSADQWSRRTMEDDPNNQGNQNVENSDLEYEKQISSKTSKSVKNAERKMQIYNKHSKINYEPSNKIIDLMNQKRKLNNKNKKNKKEERIETTEDEEDNSFNKDQKSVYPEENIRMDPMNQKRKLNDKKKRKHKKKGSKRNKAAKAKRDQDKSNSINNVVKSVYPEENVRMDPMSPVQTSNEANMRKKFKNNLRRELQGHDVKRRMEIKPISLRRDGSTFPSIKPVVARRRNTAAVPAAANISEIPGEINKRQIIPITPRPIYRKKRDISLI